MDLIRPIKFLKCQVSSKEHQYIQFGKILSKSEIIRIELLPSANVFCKQRAPNPSHVRLIPWKYRCGKQIKWFWTQDYTVRNK